MIHSKFRFFLICLVIMLFGEVSTQATIPRFGVRNYGLTVDQPFHTANNIRQDSIGRLVFDRFTFDGNKFVKHNNEIKDHTSTDVHGKWFQKDNYVVIFSTPDTSIQIDIKDHFTLPGGGAIVSKGEDKYILTLEGILNFRWEDKDLILKQRIDTEGEDNLDFILHNDTLFLKNISKSEYHLLDDISIGHTYKIVNYSSQVNGIIPLTGGRLALKNETNYQLFKSDHPYTLYVNKIGENNIITHLIDSNNRLWLSTRIEGKNKLILLTRDGSIEFIDLKIEPSAYILDLYEDDHGSIWVGSQGQGLIQVFEEGIKVINEESGLSTDNIWSITQRKNGDIYLAGGCSGIDIIDLNNQVGHTFGTACQGALFFDSQDNLWINSNGVHIISPEGSMINLAKESGLTSRTTTTILEDQDGNIWIGSRKAVHRFTGDGFEKYTAPGVEEFDRVLAMREYAQGKFIIGFGSGKVFSFNGSAYTTLDFPGIGLNTIFKDQDKNIWVCSDSSGLYLYERNKFIPLPSQSLPSSIKLVQDDLENNLWGLCEKNEIFKFNIDQAINDKDNVEVDYFGIDEGVPLLATNNDIQPNSALLNDGRIIFPNIYGAILIDPEMLYQGPSSSITQVFVNDTLINDKIRLPYGDNDLTLNLVTINLAPNESFVYKYEINNESFSIGKESRLMLNDLPKGSHQLTIKRKSHKSEWQNLKTINIYVPPLFYQYPLFWVSTFLLLALGVYLFVRWRTRLINQRNTLLKNKVEEQTQIIEKEKTQLAEALQKQVELTQELNLSQEAKDRMYAQISHEFKSPLQVINSHLSSNNGKMLPQDRERIQKNIRNLLQISNEIMDLSKAESGKLKVKKNFYSIIEIIQDQIDLKKDLIDEKKINLDFHKNEDLQFLEFDLALIQKVLNNLLSNAIKFSPVGGTITIISDSKGNKYSFEIIDDGPGIPNDEVMHLTKAFYQASNNNKEGTGIGLNLVSEILKLHETKLEIVSKEGAGSKFSFTLPMPMISQKEILKKHSFPLDLKDQLRAHTDLSKPLIMIVENSQDIQYFLRKSLRKKYRLISAYNGQSAFEFLSTVIPDLIITDQNMPLMSGIELLKKVRSTKKFMSIPILILSGSLNETTKVNAIKAGVDQILHKPIDERMLDSIIEKTLKRKKIIEDSSKLSLAHDLLPPTVQNDDAELITNLEAIFLDHIDNGRLKSSEIASMMALGEKTLRNKVKAITGLTVKEYFKKFRLEKAKMLIEENHGTLGEVAVATGFSSLSHFSRSYKAHFGNNATKQN